MKRSSTTTFRTRVTSAIAGGIPLAVAVAAFSIPRLAFADGLGPGGYAALGWMILMAFVIALLFVIGLVALVVSQSRRRG